MDWKEQIKEYIPCNEQEEKDKEIILNCIETFDDILTRENRICHITSSAFVVNKARDKALMVHHNIYNSWSWTGGHADGEENLLGVAIREVQEETGVKGVKSISREIEALDILHVIGHVKRGEYVSPHLHFSVAFLAEANENEMLTVKDDENSGVKWIPIDEVNTYSNEPHMKKVYEKLISKIKVQ
ncbi:NUDIX hydrolase [Clostridium sp. SHJSY1]|uniref:NUDIX hydrolase n=1 Tax=Clostridium sp. SHJSY1 TaxID=2942483 RepID=UPI002875E40D|nr:NUDIX hydrolase [Clostridium sp. SHJSY1]MDS0526109.1 NUDIX hydrolase [Clostridium sp. SHJSY1]